MNKYTIYCTEAQTKKAFELGAPIEESPMIDIIRNEIGNRCLRCGSNVCWYPTAEQMIGWLRKEYNIHIRIDCEGSKNYVVQLQFINSSKDIDIENHNYKGIIGHRGYSSAPEATLAAIDAALEYLTNNKI